MLSTTPPSFSPSSCQTDSVCRSTTPRTKITTYTEDHRVTVSRPRAVSGQVVRGGAVPRQLRVAGGPLLGRALRPEGRARQHPPGVETAAVSTY